jgi:hypothetical protein
LGRYETVGSVQNSDPLIAEVLGAIAYFVGRQKLVVKVLQDLDIDVCDVGKWGAAIWSQQGASDPLPASASSEAEEVWEAVQRARSRHAVAQHGTWGESDEWTYFLHGKGCRLRNISTGEVIDWDCPDVDAFDPYFFCEHLMWRLETEGESSLPEIRKRISDGSDGLRSITALIERMIGMGLINPDGTLS